MVGRLVSIWNGLLSGAMLVLGRVPPKMGLPDDFFFSRNYGLVTLFPRSICALVISAVVVVVVVVAVKSAGAWKEAIWSWGYLKNPSFYRERFGVTPRVSKHILEKTCGLLGCPPSQ